MIFEWLLKGTVFVVLFLLHLLGWNRADKWLDTMIGEDRNEQPVV